MISFEQFYKENYNTLIVEARLDRYLPMIPFKEEHRDNVRKHIKLVVDSLKREDAIIWFLRIMKGEYIREYYPDQPERYKSYTDKFPYTKAYHDQGFEFGKLLREISHYLGMAGGIPAIGNFRFDRQPIQEVLDNFDQLEEDFQLNISEDSRVIDITNELETGDIRILKDFKDGYMWLDLKRSYCSDEGNAMGHCGNSPSMNSKDNVMSLRRVVNKGQRTVSSPHLTFILNGNGQLGEMKGRNNDKPTKKYHKYIFDLLTLKVGGEYLIKGIVGGGYAPDKNFMIKDFDESLIKKLWSIRPDLKPDSMQVEDMETIEEVVAFITKKNFPIFDDYYKVEKLENGNIFFKLEPNVSEFVENRVGSDTELYKYQDYIFEGDYFEPDEIDSIDTDDIQTLYDGLREDSRHTIIDWLVDEVSPEVAGSLNYKTPTDKIVELIDDNFELSDIFRTAFADGVTAGRESELWKSYMDGLKGLEASITTPDDGSIEVNLAFDESEDGGLIIDGLVYFTLNQAELVTEFQRQELAEEEGEADEELVIHGDMSVPYYGFAGFDEEYAIERLSDSIDEL